MTSEDREKDFGRYLVSVQERDIDLLLMEEFHVSEAFVSWFAAMAGVRGAAFDGAWHSVTDVDGETDLLLRVRAGNRTIGILIENKVAATEQVNQGERYHLRAARSQEAGKFSEFVTCMCAPQIYLDGRGPDSLYQTHVSHEAIADWFGAMDGPRHAWRQRIINEAIHQGRRGYTMIPIPAVSNFHVSFWHHLQRHYPQISMRKPTPKGPRFELDCDEGRYVPTKGEFAFQNGSTRCRARFRTARHFGPPSHQG